RHVKAFRSAPHAPLTKELRENQQQVEIDLSEVHSRPSGVIFLEDARTIAGYRLYIQTNIALHSARARLEIASGDNRYSSSLWIHSICRAMIQPRNAGSYRNDARRRNTQLSARSGYPALDA